MTVFAAVLSSSSGSTLSDVTPGVLGFLVVAGIGVALIFLLRSMNKQFRELPPPPGETQPGAEPEPDASSAASTDAEGAKRG